MEASKNDLVRVGPASLQRVSKNIAVAKKVLFEDIADDFNRAFCLMNVYKEKAIYGRENYLILIETKILYLEESNFEFFAVDNSMQTDYETAASTLEDIIDLYPNHATSRFVLAIAYTRLKNATKALYNFDKAIDIKQDSPAFYYYRGWAKNIFDNYSEALLDFSKAIALYPDYAEAYFMRSVAKENLSDVDNGMNDLAIAIKLSPNNYKFYFCSANKKVRFKDYKGAIADYTKCIDLVQNDDSIPILYHQRARAKMKMLDFLGAIDDYDIILSMRPEWIYVYEQRALAKEKMGDLLGAYEDEKFYKSTSND